MTLTPLEVAFPFRSLMKPSRLALGLVVLLIYIPTNKVHAQSRSESLANEIWGGTNGIFSGLSYSPTSQHILIGMSQARKTTQVEVGVSRFLKGGSWISLAYVGSVVPLFIESDPVVDGISTSNASGPPTITLTPQPFRTVSTSNYRGIPVPTADSYQYIFGRTLFGPSETTYAFAALPVGFQVTALPRFRVRPTLGVYLGALYAARNIPIDDTSSFNFLAYAGPGIEAFVTRKRSIRLEYLYEHLSNANIGPENPGVDSGTFRVTVTRYR